MTTQYTLRVSNDSAFAGNICVYQTFDEQQTMTLMESPFSRKIIGFDTFGAPPLLGDAVDRSFAESGQTDPDNGIPKAELEHCLQYKGIRSCELIAGDIKQTLPDYVQKNPALKVSLLHIDTELYESAAIGLDLLWDKIVPGGLLVLDDYGTEAGGTRAVDEFFAGQDVRIRKLPISQTCPSYIRKR